ncbi:alpha/beta-hydrolase family protein [Gordonia zhaorongruii]|uniref:alpha/beta-hydrolase family protein n=1 Tax=Gordonia zhaorongruii TaxID=2597659 RepID=UPI00117DD002|nr:alpha/beta-hydrolase family protein [Gordonia zhaorongruii]
MTAARAADGIHPAALLGGAAGWALSLAPGQLPRPALLSAAAATVFALLGLGAGALLGRYVLPRSLRHRTAPRQLVIGSLIAAAAILIGALWWQEEVRGTFGLPPAGIGWVAATGLIPLAAATAVSRLPRRALMIGALTIAAIGAPAAGAHAAPDLPDDAHVVYSAVDDPEHPSADRFDARAEDLVRRWRASGGLHRRAVVIAVPTGSGWVDSAAVDGFRRHFGGSVRILALQYSQVPSWQAYLSSPQDAGSSATAVVRALDATLSRISPDERPEVYLFGQSLGAIGADAARSWAAGHDVPVAGTVLAGAPAGTVESLPDCAPRVSLANATDPVTEFSPSLLWHRPVQPGGTRTVGQQPTLHAPWLPGVSFIGTALDLAVSLDGPSGSGHNYGIEQGLAAGSIPGGCQTIGPRAAS